MNRFARNFLVFLLTFAIGFALLAAWDRWVEPRPARFSNFLTVA